MNGPVKYQLNELRKAVERLGDALERHELHPTAAMPVMKQLQEVSAHVNNLATGLNRRDDMPEWIRNNPPPMRSPDLSQQTDE